MNAPRLLALSFLFAPLLAQSPPCFSLNDANNNISGTLTAATLSGYDLRAWQVIPTTPVVAQSIQLYTTNTLAATVVRYMSLEIWSENPATNQPGTRIAGGTWKVSNPLGFAWQGANLDATTILLPATPYWLVWSDSGGSRLPVDPAGTTLPMVLRGSSATVWNTQAPSALKFRIFCGLLDAQGVAPFGSPCAGSTGRLGTVFTNQPPNVGNVNFQFEGTGFPSGVLAVMAFGLNPVWVSVPLPGFATGCMQHTDIVASTFATTGTGTIRGPTAAGHVLFPVAIPANGALIGLMVAGQIGALDTGLVAPLPFMVSNALRVTLF